jgi:cell division protein FtsZ
MTAMVQPEILPPSPSQPHQVDSNTEVDDFAVRGQISASPIIKAIGVGGGGCNAVRSMIEAGLRGVDCILTNTDFPSSKQAETYLRIQLGAVLTHGLGAGSDPEIGRRAALESAAMIAEALDGADLVFVAAGMGGGTGTGAAPVIAEIARSAGILTVGVVTKPFFYEGKRRMQQAEAGITLLKQAVDSLMVIPNERLRKQGDKGMTILDAFKPANLVLHHAIRGISELIHTEGHINLDFADLRTIMANRGMATMGIGTAKGPQRAEEAARMAINNPLLEGFDFSRAKGVLVNISGSSSMSLWEFDQAAEIIQKSMGDDVEMITGLVIREDLGEVMQVTAIATGAEVQPSPPKVPAR